MRKQDGTMAQPSSFRSLPPRAVSCGAQSADTFGANNARIRQTRVASGTTFARERRMPGAHVKDIQANENGNPERYAHARQRKRRRCADRPTTDVRARA